MGALAPWASTTRASLLLGTPGPQRVGVGLLDSLARQWGLAPEGRGGLVV